MQLPALRSPRVSNPLARPGVDTVTIIPVTIVITDTVQAPTIPAAVTITPATITIVDVVQTVTMSQSGQVKVRVSGVWVGKPMKARVNGAWAAKVNRGHAGGAWQPFGTPARSDLYYDAYGDLY